MPTPSSLGALEAITGRRSVRRFLPRPVDRATVEAILEAAVRAPSGTNSQPWHVDVVAGAAREAVSSAVLAAAAAGKLSMEYTYSPEPIPEPYLARRRKVGYDLYGLYGIARTDHAARRQAYYWNFDFFGAPVGLFFSMDRRLLHGSWLDMGMFIQNVMVAARAYGLETCPQAAWCEYGNEVHAAVGIPADRVLVTGMALGVEDASAPANRLRTEREPVGAFARFQGF
jgi:nitroreductase